MAEISCGTPINVAIQEAIMIAIQYRVPVNFDLNDIDVTVTKDSVYSNIVAKYKAALHTGVKSISDEPFLKFNHQMSKPIRIKIEGGDTIYDSVTIAKGLAINTNNIIVFTFNGIDVYVTKDSQEKDLIQKYHDALMMRWTEVTDRPWTPDEVARITYREMRLKDAEKIKSKICSLIDELARL